VKVVEDSREAKFERTDTRDRPNKYYPFWFSYSK
jgi:hypothetical protein